MKKKVGFIIIPLIIVAILGVWFLKNGKVTDTNVKQDTQQPQTEQNVDTDKNEHGNTDKEEADFSLEETVLIDGSDSCIPCKEMAPVLEKMNEEMQGVAFVKFVDVWKYPEAAENVPIQVIPTQILFHANGTPFVPSDGLAQKIQFDMYSSRDTGEHVFTVHQGGLTEEEMRLILNEMGVSD